MRVWIAEGCIACRACEYECPDVFQVVETTSTIRREVRADGVQDPNRARCALSEAAADRHAERIAHAASGCPVGVIRIEEAEAPADACGASAGAS